MMASSMGRARPSGDVQSLVDVEVSVHAPGEREGSDVSTGHSGVLSRSGASSCAS
jgi:hypothetical protein